MKPYLKPKAETDNMISKKELKELIADQLGNRLSEEWCLHTADTHFFLPDYEDAEALIHTSKMAQLAKKEGAGKRGESFDCDDFSLLLKARFTYGNYRDPDKYQNRPHCFGIVWGLLPFPFPHSMNWMVTDKRKFYFIEPQKEKIAPLSQCQHYRYINFMLV
jgi:hypothetical protein